MNVVRRKFAAAALGGVMLFSVAGAPAAQAADYPPLPTKVSCKAKAVKKKSKIKINMGPNLAGNGYYTFRLDRKKKNGKVIRYLKTYKTKGGAETRTVNVKKGKWRAKCYGEAFPVAAPAFDATSKWVRIKR